MKHSLGLLASTLFCIAVYAQDYSKFKVAPAVHYKATPFDIKDVKLLKGSPFAKAMDLNETYMLQLSADRFLHRWRTNAGLPAKAPLYDGWEATSSHMLGHYLSALAMQYAATGDKHFLDRVNYIVSELDTCQRARNTGYIGGIPNEEQLWKEVTSGDIRTGGFDLNGAWVPWYMLHKIWAGLIDAYLYCNNDKAKEVVVKLSDWAYEKFMPLPDSSFQKMMMAEFGGMNESFATVYAITGNKKYLDLSYRFYDKRVMEPLANQTDKLGGLHANTQIPKIIGAAVQYELTGNKRDSTIASFFYHAVINSHTYANGGNSNYESFNAANKFANALSTNTSETCNTYNMLKLNSHLFREAPDAALADYYERALYNHILASQHPETGMLCYYVALKSGKQKKYSTPFESFWCCVGTGLENHASYGNSIYFKSDDGGLYVNLFIPSILTWKEKNIQIKQETNYPEEASTKLTIVSKKAASFPIKIRYPKWATNGVELLVNGQPITTEQKPGSYITINRTWKNNDQIMLRMPMSLYSEPMPDAPSKAALFYGPLLLAGELGKEKPAALGVPVLITNNQPIAQWLKASPTNKTEFITSGAGRPADVKLVPFYKAYDQRYVVYWDMFTTQDWENKKAAYEKEQAIQNDIAARTIDVLRLGEQQPEKDHNLTGDNTGVGDNDERKFRDAPNGGWFGFTMKTAMDTASQLMVTYWGGDGGGRAFDILVNGTVVGSEKLSSEKPGQYFDRVYNIPIPVVGNKLAMDIKFKGKPGNIAGGVYEVRLVKTK